MYDAYEPSTAKEDVKEKEPVVEPIKVEKQEVEQEKKEEDDTLDNWEDSEVAGNDDAESAETSHVKKMNGKYRYEVTNFSSMNVFENVECSGHNV